MKFIQKNVHSHRERERETEQIEQSYVEERERNHEKNRCYECAL